MPSRTLSASCCGVGAAASGILSPVFKFNRPVGQ
jgi:hypothetical protein